jgi:hypothetical protein
MMLRATGEPVTLWRRKWTGERCPECSNDRVNVGMSRCPLCLLPGSLVKLANGSYKAIEEIRTGNQIVSHTGATRTVTELLSRHTREDLLKFKVWGNTILNLQTTTNHPIYVLRPTRASNGAIDKESLDMAKAAFLPAEQVIIGDYLCYPLDQQFDSSLTKEQARLLGYYVAEGSIIYQNGSPDTVSFGFAQEETDYIEEVFGLIRTVFNYAQGSVGQVGVSQGVDLRFANTQIGSFFDKYIGANSRVVQTTKNLTPEIFALSREKALSFIGAWLNGDGTVFETSRTIAAKIDTSDINLARQLLALCLKHKLPATLGARKNNNGPNDPNTVTRIYCVEFASTALVHLQPYCNKITKTKTSVKTNNSRVKFVDNYVLFPIKAIERKEYHGKVYNLEVETDESYTIEGYAIHNCFGTGFVGGFVEFINTREANGRIFMRVGPTEEKLTLETTGLHQAFAPGCWTLPVPTVRDWDIVVRYDSDTGEETWRYEVMSVTRNKGFYNVPTVQNFSLIRLDKTDPRYNLRWVDLADNLVGQLSGDHDNADLLQTQIENRFGDGAGDQGFSDGYKVGFLNGFDDGKQNEDYQPYFDHRTQAKIVPPTNLPSTEAWLLGLQTGYRDGFKEGQDATRKDGYYVWTAPRDPNAVTQEQITGEPTTRDYDEAQQHPETWNP